MKSERYFYHEENEGIAKTIRDIETNKWYYPLELIDYLESQLKEEKEKNAILQRKIDLVGGLHLMDNLKTNK